MKDEDRIVDLLTGQLIRQDKLEAGLNRLTTRVDQLGTGLNILVGMLENLVAIQERQEKLLIKIAEILADDVPKFDELIEMEQLEGGKKVILRKYR